MRAGKIADQRKHLVAVPFERADKPPGRILRRGQQQGCRQTADPNLAGQSCLGVEAKPNAGNGKPVQKRQRLGRATAVNRDKHDDNVILGKRRRGARQGRQFGNAGRAPCRPEIDQNGAPGKIRHQKFGACFIGDDTGHRRRVFA